MGEKELASFFGGFTLKESEPFKKKGKKDTTGQLGLGSPCPIHA